MIGIKTGVLSSTSFLWIKKPDGSRLFVSCSGIPLGPFKTCCLDSSLKTLLNIKLQ